MRLYLIQHGLSLKDEEDPKKSLSQKGREETVKIANFLRSKDIKADEIWHSRKTRSVQTSEILAKTLNNKMIARDDLNPNDPVDAFPGDLQTQNKDIMIVGHLPFLGKLASFLLAGSSEKDVVLFRNSGVACLEYNGNWRLAWYIVPDIAGE